MDANKTARKKALTPKESTFARLYVETGNATEAYRQAYDHNGNDTTACNDAHDVLHREPVTAYVADLQAEHRERHKVTVDGLTWERFQDGKAYSWRPAIPGREFTMGRSRAQLLQD